MVRPVSRTDREQVDQFPSEYAHYGQRFTIGQKYPILLKLFDFPGRGGDMGCERGQYRELMTVRVGVCRSGGFFCLYNLYLLLLGRVN